MSPKFLTFIPLLFVAQASWAQTSTEPAAAPTESNPAATATPSQPTSVPPSTPLPRYEVKRRSAFAVETRGRAPFWPIGWSKQGPAAVVADKQVEVDDQLFKVTSILVGNPSMAVINGRSYEEGQLIRLPKSAPQIRPRLYRIGDGQVVIQVQNQLVSVQLKRPELKDPKPETELLNEEKDDILPVTSESKKSASAR
jgi:hypothetical protein